MLERSENVLKAAIANPLIKVQHQKKSVNSDFISTTIENLDREIENLEKLHKELEAGIKLEVEWAVE